MITMKTFVKFHQTDAAGLIFFNNIFTIAHEAYEQMLISEGFGIGEILREKEYLLPLVHVEADYNLPLYPGDEITVQALVSRLGKTAYTLSYRVLKNETIAASVKTVHVCIDKKSGKKMPLPTDFRSGLQKHFGAFEDRENEIIQRS